MLSTESLGSAERLTSTLLTFKDHMVHNRPGVVTADRGSAVGVRWQFATTREQGGEKIVFLLSKQGKKTEETRLGVLGSDNMVRSGHQVVGEFRNPGIFPEVAAWLYKQVAEIYKLDNELAARWASYAYAQDNRDLKVVLAAFMLVQARKGDPVMDDGKVSFRDDDFRDVGEAMLLAYDKGKTSPTFDAKMLLRVRDVLRVPAVAQMNREMGFGSSARRPFEGRWNDTVTKWLNHREKNPKIMAGLIKGSQRTLIMRLAERVRYKPISPKFFEDLRWKQVQSDGGHRSILVGGAVKAADSWNDLTEVQICEKITKEKLDWKHVVGKLPKTVGATRAIVAATIESGGISAKELVILTPTLEELDLLKVPSIKKKWDAALQSASDMRASNVATRVKSRQAKEGLEKAADAALQNAVAKEMKQLRIYFFVDVSGSMESAIESAKLYLKKFIPAFPAGSVHVATFNTNGKVVSFKAQTAAAVEHAFSFIRASGGTSHREGIKALSSFKPAPDEDTLFIFVGDEGEHGSFAPDVVHSGLRPSAFGLLRVPGNGSIIRDTAGELKIPCFLIDENTFSDIYAIPQTIRNLIHSTPVSQQRTVFAAAPRRSLVDQILATPLLTKPVWAS